MRVCLSLLLLPSENEIQHLAVQSDSSHNPARKPPIVAEVTRTNHNGSTEEFSNQNKRKPLRSTLFVSDLDLSQVCLPAAVPGQIMLFHRVWVRLAFVSSGVLSSNICHSGDFSVLYTISLKALANV